MEPLPWVLFIIPSIPVLGYCQISYALSDITANVFTFGGSTIKEPLPSPSGLWAVSGAVCGVGTGCQRGLGRAITCIL